MMRELEAVKHRCGAIEAVRSLNIPTSTPKRRVPENLLFSNRCSVLQMADTKKFKTNIINTC